MQDEHFLKLWVEAHAFSGEPTTIADVLGSRFDVLRERVGTIGATYERQAPRPTPRLGARSRLAWLFARAIPAGVLAGVAVAAIAGASATTAPGTRTAQAAIPPSALHALA